MMEPFKTRDASNCNGAATSGYADSVDPSRSDQSGIDCGLLVSVSLVGKIREEVRPNARRRRSNRSPSN
jgi:hypothetical protein